MKNEAEASKWLHKAAEVGDPNAKSRLGELYFHGTGPVPQDKRKGVEFYKEAASAGVVTSQFNLAYLYLTGDGVPKNSLMAETLFRKAADKGFVMAMVNLAQMYRTGYGEVPKDVELAKKWLELAAPYDPNAKELLKVINESGE